MPAHRWQKCARKTLVTHDWICKVALSSKVIIGPKLSENIEEIDTCFDKFVNKSISGNFSFQQIRPSLVSSHLRKLCMRKATGLDTVSARLLRECFDIISDSLALIFNLTISSCGSVRMSRY